MTLSLSQDWRLFVSLEEYYRFVGSVEGRCVCVWGGGFVILLGLYHYLGWVRIWIHIRYYKNSLASVAM